MRIDLNLGNLEPVQNSESRRSGQSSQNLDGRSRQDDAQLASGSSNLARLTSAALDQPEVRTDRVAQLRESISNGSYSVSNGLLADAMLHDLN